MDLLAIVNTPEVRKVAQELSERYWPNAEILTLSAAEAAAKPEIFAKNPRYVIMDLGDAKQEVLESVSQIMQCCASASAIVFVGNNNDVKFYRELIKLGASDYMLMPLGVDDVYSIMMSASMAKMDHSGLHLHEQKAAKLITVMGVHGGVGTSSFVVNASWIIAEELQKNVAIVDLDVHFGTVALSLDVEPSIGFRDALESPNRVDELFVEGSLVKASPRLYVLAAEENMTDYIVFNDHAIDKLISKLREKRDFVVMDVPRSSLVRCPQLFTNADVIILIAELTISGLRDTVTILNQVRRVVSGKDVRVVINKKREKDVGQLPLKDFETQIGMAVSAILPDAPGVISAAMNNGKAAPLMYPQSKVVEVLRALCLSIADTTHVVKKNNSFIKSLINRFA